VDERDSRFSIRSLNHAPSGVIKPSTLFPECVEDWIGEDNPVRVIDVLVDDLDLTELGFGGVDPEATGRPAASLPCNRAMPGTRTIVVSTTPADDLPEPFLSRLKKINR